MGIRQGAKSLLDMLFLHNTEADRIKSFDQMGGMPMPSLAATKKDIPFEDFGDITLIGKPENFVPEKVGNKLFTADAYTVRAPRPVRLAKKDAPDLFKKEYEPIMGGSRARSDAAALESLGNKRSIRDHEYSNMEGFFQSDNSARVKYLNDRGIKYTPNKFGFVDYNDWVKKVDPQDHAQWVSQQMDKYFEPDRYFVKLNNVGNVDLTPYTLENVTAFMKRKAGAGQESVFMGGSTAEQRANLAEELRSLDEAKGYRENIVSQADAADVYEELKSRQWDLMQSIAPYYKGDSEDFGFLDYVGEMLLAANKHNLGSVRRALDHYGFNDVPDSLVKKIEDWRSDLSKSPVQYLESKPERAVDLSEFGGAIVPESTSQGIIDILQNRGIKVEKYGDEAERTAAREKFQNLMFQVAPFALPTAAASTLGATMFKPTEALASPDAPTKANAASLYNPYRAAKIEAEQLRAKQRDPLGFDLTDVKRDPNAGTDILGAIGAGIERSIHSLPHLLTPEGTAQFVGGALGAPRAFELMDKQIQQKAPDYQPEGEMTDKERTLWQLLGEMASPY
jgi:hypothetical protein